MNDLKNLQFLVKLGSFSFYIFYVELGYHPHYKLEQRISLKKKQTMVTGLQIVTMNREYFFPFISVESGINKQ